MNLTKTAFKFAEWFNSDKFPEELETSNVEETVLAWADYSETDLEDNLDNLCQRIIDLGIL